MAIELRRAPGCQSHVYYPVPLDHPQFAGQWEVEKHPYHAQRELLVWYPEVAKHYDPLEAAALVLQKLSAASRQDKTLNLKAVFKKYDADGGGSIDRDEFAAVLEEFKILLSPAEVAAVFKIFDPDGGGTISYIEFVYSVFNRRKFIKGVREAREKDRLRKMQKAAPKAPRSDGTGKVRPARLKRKAATDDGDGNAGDTGGYLNHSIAYAFIKKQDEERRKAKQKEMRKPKGKTPNDGYAGWPADGPRIPKKPSKPALQHGASPRIVKGRSRKKASPSASAPETANMVLSAFASAKVGDNNGARKVTSGHAEGTHNAAATATKIVETCDEDIIAEVESTLALNQWMAVNLGRIKDLFLKMDTDGSGTCSTKEFLVLLREMKNTKEKQVRAIYDVRHEETANLTTKWKHKSDAKNGRSKTKQAAEIDFDLVAKAFHMIDVDGSGEISLRELERFVRRGRNMEGQLKQKARDALANISAREALNIKVNTFGGLTPRRPRVSPRKSRKTTMARPSTRTLSRLSTVNLNSTRPGKEIKVVEVGVNKEKTESEVLGVLETWMNVHIIRIKDIFFEMDIDKSGALSVQEFIQLFSKIGEGIQPEQMTRLFKNLDEDNSGDVTLEELQRYMRRRRKELAEEGTDRSAARIKLSGGIEFETFVFME